MVAPNPWDKIKTKPEKPIDEQFEKEVERMFKSIKKESK